MKQLSMQSERTYFAPESDVLEVRFETNILSGEGGGHEGDDDDDPE